MRRILVVDDESHILIMLKKMLERAGFEVDLAANGSEGVEVFKKSQPDLVITDIIMPEKEGLETIREMRRIKPDLKVIAMSGGGKVSAESYLDIARIFGAGKVIAKPFTQKELVSAVQSMLSEEDGEGEESYRREKDGNGLEKENS